MSKVQGSGRLPSAPRHSAKPEPRSGSRPYGRVSTGATVQPLVPDSPRLFGHTAGAIDLNAVAQRESRLLTAPLSELVLEHADLSRWLNLAYAETWADQHAEKTARITAVWQAIRRRFPEHAAKMMRGAE